MVDRNTLMKLLCVAVVAAVMLPAGNILFPFVSDALNGLQFRALEAAVTATVGFGISTLLG